MIDRMIKFAQLSVSTGDSRLAGRGIAEIVKFLMARVPPNRHQELMERLRHKIWTLNEIEISNKNLVPGSALGQSLTFIKNILAGHNPTYVREVLQHIVFNLTI